MNYKVAVVGTREITSAFSVLGFDTFCVYSTQECIKTLLKLKENNDEEGDEKNAYAIIFVVEDLIKSIPEDEYKKINTGALPAIIPLPGHKGSTGFGETKLRKIVEKAIGSDIFNK